MSEEAIINDGIPITIAGNEYTMRRLGLRDVFKVARILGNGVATMGGTEDDLSPAAVMQVLVASMTANEDEVLNLMADILGIERETLDDPDLFPMDSVIDIFAKLAEHQDLKAFLAKVGSITQPTKTN